MRLTSSASLSLGCLLASVLPVACSSTEAGSEGGACYANGTCDTGLSCLSDLCVAEGSDDGSGGNGAPDDDGAGGDGNASGGNASGGNSSGGSGTGGNGTGGNGTGGESSVPGPELILNGDFVDGINSWSLTLNAGGGAYSTADDEVCFQATGVSNLSSTLGYPGDLSDAFDLEPGSYTFEYSIRGYGEGEAKVGLAESPYTTITSYEFSPFEDTYTHYSQVFTVDTAQENVGLAFNLTTYGYDDVLGYFYLCVDEVSLRKN